MGGCLLGTTVFFPYNQAPNVVIALGCVTHANIVEIICVCYLYYNVLQSFLASQALQPFQMDGRYIEIASQHGSF